MDKLHYEEMVEALKELEQEKCIQGKKIYLFGHCNATEELIDLLLSKKYQPIAILDNNENKHGRDYKGIVVTSPQEILKDNQEQTIVCIVARAYAAMSEQLKRLGYRGQIRKLVDYNSYAEYSLSDDTINRMKKRVKRGEAILNTLNQKYSGYLKIFCPFPALGDIYYMMSYLPHFLKKLGAERCMIGVIGTACEQTVYLFDEYNVEVFSQTQMDEVIQAALYTGDKNTFIPHQDRPYVVDLHKALYTKLIPLEKIYCCGVFGLPTNTGAYNPGKFHDYAGLDEIPKGNSVILSPYAKSVVALPDSVWKQIVGFYRSMGKDCFTNVVGNELPLPGTTAISPRISEMKSVVERAGIFVGIRSGLCDVLKTANAERIVLFPDYNYCDTQWKAIDMYRIEEWENIVIKDGFTWERK